MTSKKKVIVCIEDEVEIIDLIELILNRREIEFVSAVNGREGLETIRKLKPDLVLLDLMMPGDMDGRAVYQAMRADDELEDIPVAIVTAVDTTPIAKVLWTHIAKAQAHITKPFDPQELLQVVDRLLEIET